MPLLSLTLTDSSGMLTLGSGTSAVASFLVHAESASRALLSEPSMSIASFFSWVLSMGFAWLVVASLPSTFEPHVESDRAKVEAIAMLATLVLLSFRRRFTFPYSMVMHAGWHVGSGMPDGAVRLDPPSLCSTTLAMQDASIGCFSVSCCQPGDSKAICRRIAETGLFVRACRHVPLAWLSVAFVAHLRSPRQRR